MDGFQMRGKEKPLKENRGTEIAETTVESKRNKWKVPITSESKETISLDMGGIFDLLWEKECGTRQSLAIQIPDTICFRDESIKTDWFFTSQKDGKFYKKNTGNVTKEKIFEALTKQRKKKNRSPINENKTPHSNSSKCDIVAYACFEQMKHGKKTVEYKYMDREELYNFIFNMMNKKDMKAGFLQKFVIPKGRNNHLIKVHWTNNVTLIEVGMNKFDLYDNSVNIQDRCTVVEGDKRFVQGQSLTPTFTNQIQRVCTNIIRHIYRATDCQIVREIVFLMKIDESSKLWFINCLKCRTVVESQTLEQFKWINYRIYFDIERSHQKEAKEKEVKEKKKEVYKIFSPSGIDNVVADLYCCPHCGTTFKPEEAFNISYIIAIYHFEQKLLKEWEKESKNQRSEAPDVPPIIQYLERNMGKIRYQQAKNNPKFLFKTFKVCKLCAEEYKHTAFVNNMKLDGTTIETKKKEPKISERIRELAEAKNNNTPIKSFSQILKEMQTNRQDLQIPSRIERPNTYSPKTTLPLISPKSTLIPIKPFTSLAKNTGDLQPLDK
ncbi:hypothetical protein ABK040_009807 [Willaertia magna]